MYLQENRAPGRRADVQLPSPTSVSHMRPAAAAQPALPMPVNVAGKGRKSRLARSTAEPSTAVDRIPPAKLDAKYEAAAQGMHSHAESGNQAAKKSLVELQV